MTYVTARDGEPPEIVVCVEGNYFYIPMEKQQLLRLAGDLLALAMRMNDEPGPVDP